MKTNCAGFVWGVILTAIFLAAEAIPVSVFAQTPASSTPPPTPYQVIERGANHRVWQRTDYETRPDGTVVPHLHQYTELATGLSYKKNGQWVDAVEQIEPFPAGAIANQGQYQVIFANNLNSAGAIDQQTPDAKRLRSNILGLAYHDSSSGQSVLIAQIQDSTGELISSNQVLYPNAFSGVQADVRYTYKKGSFEQDVILREQPPAPESLGLNSATTEIEVLTEFLNPPAATLKEHVRPNQLPDQDISWGVARLGHGKAFDLGEPPNRPSRVLVRRQYETVNGRTILIEAIPLPDIQPQLQNLPLQASATPRAVPVPGHSSFQPDATPGTPQPTSASGPTPVGPVPSPGVPSRTSPAAAPKVEQASSLSRRPQSLASLLSAFPISARPNVAPHPMTLAQTTPPAQGFVLDYQELNADQTDFTFQTGATYYVPADLGLWGTTTFAGGSFIKFDEDNGGFCVYSAINNQGDPAHPTVLTSMNDDSVGEIIAGSTGQPGPLMTDPLDVYTHYVELHNLRFYGAEVAVFNWMDGSTNVFWNCEFFNCGETIDLTCGNVVLRNVLNCGVNYYGSDAGANLSDCWFSLDAQNVTALDQQYVCDGGTFFGYPDGAVNVTVVVTNCILFGATADLMSAGAKSKDVVTNATFQTGGNDGYYLAANSPWHGAGTATIDPGLVAEFQTMTTYAPQAGGWPDTNATDLGYHYPVNESSYYDGVPDWWKLEYFGSYAYTGSDVDAAGNTLLYDYQNNIDPDTINFTVRLGNQHFNTATATGTFLPLAGVPGYEAVLVDNAAFSTARWVPYDGQVHLTLNGSDGAHQVWLGLKGPAPGAPPNWIGTTVYRDQVAPVVFITGPTNLPSWTTAVPYVQLQGFADKSLQSVTYDVSNSLTVLTGLPGILGGHYLDTNLLAVTTNYFQCYDVPLTNGMNLLTLHVTDLAGNTTVTNLHVSLNFSLASNPVVQLTWPQNGMQICGGSFTLRGQVDDPTASVSATITDTHGDTNVITGDVERTGVLWVENLPLNSGTNWITLSVTNAAGKATQTQLAVVQSPMTLALTSINDDLWQPVVDVSGVISDPSYQVWVNGVQGTNNGDGTWNAHNVPISASGVASFDMSATNSSGDPDASTNVYKPAEIVLQSAVWNTDTLSDMGALEGWETNSVAGNYFATTGGWETDDTLYENTNQVPQSYNNDLLLIGTNQTVYADYLATSLGGAWFSEDYPADIQLEEGALAYTGTGICRNYVENSQVRMVLHPGGKGLINAQSVFQLSATATELLLTAPTEVALPPAAVTVAGLALGADGNAFTTFPDGGDPVDVTPQTGVPMYSFTLNQQKYRVIIEVGNSVPLQPDHVVNSANFSVGQSLPFSPLWRPATPPYTNATAGWWLPGSFVNEQPYDYCPSAYDEDGLLLNRNLLVDGTLSTPCWYVDQLLPGTATLKMTLSFANGQTVNVVQTGQYNVYKPTFTFATNSSPATVNVGDSAECGANSLMVGTNSGAGAMMFNLTVQSQFPGEVDDCQLVNSWWSATFNAAPFLNTGGGTDGAFWLDGEMNTDDQTLAQGSQGTSYSGVCIFDDQPCTSLSPLYLSASRNDSCKTYFSFRPSGAGSIFVTLGRVNWGWFGNALDVYNFPSWTWTLTTGGITPPTFTATQEFPVWQYTY